MAKLNDDNNIRNILDNIFKYDRNLPDFQVIQLKKNWHKIIGNQLFEHTSPQKIIKKTLYIYCSHQGWVNVLQFYKENIITNIKELFKNKIDINDIKFTFYKKRP